MPTGGAGNVRSVAISLIVAAVLAVIGLGTLFVSPWLGAPCLAAAVILGVMAFVGTAAKSDEVMAEADEPVETPHLPGPGNPESGVE